MTRVHTIKTIGYAAMLVSLLLLTVNKLQAQLIPGQAHYFINAKSGQFMVIAGSDLENGGNAIQWQNAGQQDAQWILLPEDDTWFLIKNSHSGKYLVVADGSKEDGANVLQWDNLGQADARWRLQEAGNGHFWVINKNSGKYLIPLDASTDMGANLVQWYSEGRDYARWNVTPANGSHAHWKLQSSVVTDTTIAEVAVRLGDVDNLGFGWPVNFDPFTGNSTPIHPYPWTPEENQVAGMDRILVVSSYEGNPPGGADGYALTTKRPHNSPTNFTMEFPLPESGLKKVMMQIFIDDFQAPKFSSSYQFKLNGKRIPYVEKLINSITQSGPVGKLISFVLLEEDLELLRDGKLDISIDDPHTGAGDGFAIDFIQLLLNPKEYNHTCSLTGAVLTSIGRPIENCLVNSGGMAEMKTDLGGRFTLEDVPSGFVNITVQKYGYKTFSVMIDMTDGESKEIEIVLQKREMESREFFVKELKENGKVVIYGIHFDSGEDEPTKESAQACLVLRDLLFNMEDSRFRIRAYTDAIGDEASNLDLANRRAEKLVRWLLEEGLQEGLVVPVGHGEGNPIASNRTEEGRMLNRRIELELITD